MDLRLYDTLTKEKRPFVPLDPNNVRMYVCGPTVYDFAHIGNARPVIVFDVLFRLLRHLYGEKHVKYVRNITDVDDKINERAAARGVSIRTLTEKTYEDFKIDVKKLRCLEPTIEPRATEHIVEMRTIIERLVRGGFAYVEQDHVLFSPQAMNAANSVLPRYGALANRTLDEMIAGARVDVAPYKHDTTDFVLWKPSKRGEPSWPSPAGIAVEGRPGWHIECSAMAWKHLGEQFDIHGGGIDLVFPHHENELAQTCCAFHEARMANVWMHNGFLQVEGEKMSKSVGNFFKIKDFRAKKFGGRTWSGWILKFAMLQAHYRQPIDWSVRLLEQSEVRINRWRDFAAERTIRKQNPTLFQEFVEALSDDLNTPEAFAVVDRAVKGDNPTDEDRYTVYQILQFLGLRGKQTRVAKTAALFGSLVESIQNISPNKWSELDSVMQTADGYHLIEAKSHPEIEFMVQLDALAEYWRNFKLDPNLKTALRSSPPVSKHRYVPRRNLQLLVETFGRRMRDLGCFSTNDWDNFAKATLDRPRFKDGSLKPEAQLFAHLNALADIGESARLNSKSFSNELTAYKNTLLKEAEPAQNDFEKEVRRLIADRDAARARRDFTESDRIRDDLIGMGVVIKDSKDGTTWERAK